MRELYRLRDIIILFYKKYEIWVNYFVKFIMGIIIFSTIGSMGYVSKLGSFPVIFLLGLLTAFLPTVWIGFFATAIIVTQMAFVSIDTAIIVGIVLICILLFYVRVFPEDSILIFAMLIAYYFKVPFAIVLIGGMYYGFKAIAPVIIGTVIWFSAPIMVESCNTGGVTVGSFSDLSNILEIPATFAGTYSNIVESMLTNQTWIVASIIFTMVIILVYIISSMEVDYSHYIALVVGSLLNILGFILAGVMLKLSVTIVGAIFSTVFSVAIAFVLQFFDRVLDFSSAEKVQFEDEDYYYYVKVIPKIVSKKRRTKE